MPEPTPFERLHFASNMAHSAEREEESGNEMNLQGHFEQDAMRAALVACSTLCGKKHNRYLKTRELLLQAISQLDEESHS